MIVWINGAFGVGKTTVARALSAKWPSALLFDPEQIGFMLRRIVPEDFQTGDFQDLSLWRQLTVETAIGLLRQTNRPLIVPMTLVNPAYFEEVVGELRKRGTEIYHFALVGSQETIRRRIRRRWQLPGSKRWTLAQIDRCQKALESPEFKVHIRTDHRSVDEILEETLSNLPADLPAAIQTAPGV
jgi:adenylate kinase family enzyme